MDFNYTSDQDMLRDSLARYLQQEYDYHERGRIVAGGGFSAKAWSDFASFGWLGAALPEDAGGFGGGGVEAGIVAEAFGRHIVLEPYLWTVIVGGTLLRFGAEGDRRDALLGSMIEGSLQLALAAHESDAGHDFTQIATVATPASDGKGWTLDGRKAIVPNGGVADKFFVTAKLAGTGAGTGGVSLFLIDRDAPGVSLRTFRLNDDSNAAELTLSNVAVARADLVGAEGDALALLELAADHGAAAVCAETVGSCAYLLDTTCEYLKTREQYGAPLAKLQVIQHRLADMYVAVELCRSRALMAADALDKPAAERMRAISAARVQAIRCAKLVGRDAVQLHGGMGMSEELDVSAHFKRLMTTPLFFGDEAFHLARFADSAEQVAEMP